ncbi:MAG: TIR domain-containing protein, partial [Verrucomicrobiota bacterium]
MATRKIFVSFEYRDLRYKNLLVAWSKNPDFADFYINDQSVTEPVDSEKAGPIKRVISARINDATGLLCIVGEKTAESRWVSWEINKAIELGKHLIAVKIEKACETPAALKGAGATWAL